MSFHYFEHYRTGVNKIHLHFCKTKSGDLILLLQEGLGASLALRENYQVTVCKVASTQRSPNLTVTV